MATLRAAALLLDGGLLVFALALLLSRSIALRDPSDFLTVALFLGTPIVNAVAVILQARTST
jgi:hypothetical protein